jgi:ubiquinone/menaquinone biosynthesis C-methylase UbiE
MQNNNVTVVDGDATEMPFGDGEFTAAVSLTMLHHVPTPMLQDRLFAEVRRVLQPGGLFVGMDAVDTWSLHLMHWGRHARSRRSGTPRTKVEKSRFRRRDRRKRETRFSFLCQAARTMNLVNSERGNNPMKQMFLAFALTLALPLLTFANGEENSVRKALDAYDQAVAKKV